jgi:hypothetical protein
MKAQDQPDEPDVSEELSEEMELVGDELTANRSPHGQTAVSGLYEVRKRGHHAGAVQEPLGTVAGVRPVRKEVLRLDVDRLYPQMTASGTIHGLFATRIHWIASLTPSGPDSWTGSIWYKDGASVSFPYTTVDVKVVQSHSPGQRRAKVTFSGGGVPKRKRTFRFKSRYYHPVEFEFDWAEGEAATLTVDTCTHPDRPATLPCETLSIAQVFRRSGFDVSVKPGAAVPLGEAGPGALWSDQEMHDAMQVYWSSFAATAQWAMWIFFASLHESGSGLGGIMFDDIGPNHRQGTALFVDSFISQAPAGDPNPAAWVDRTRFWTACHEMGHAFNLAHSWQKSLGVPWIPLVDEPEARSFMNYFFFVAGGQKAFFADFEYRFSNQELLFMRHAPARFVRMGDADWFDHHGFQEAAVSVDPPLTLTLRANREAAVFEYMEPVTLELKLKNTSSEPRLVDRRILAENEAMIVIVKKDGSSARQLLPFAQRCYAPETTVLMSGESMYESLLASVGLNGWEIADPGSYTIQVALRVGEEDVVSNPLRLLVEPPASRQEEFLGPSFFSEDVGRIIAFNGSRALKGGNTVLAQVAEELPDRRVALHARYALGSVLAKDYKELVTDPEGPQQLSVEVREAEHDEAQKLIGEALIAKPETAVESFGHIEYRRLADRYSDWLAEEGTEAEAAAAQETLYETLAARTVRGRPIRQEVLKEIKAHRRELAPKSSA